MKSSVNRDELARLIIEVLHRKLHVPQGCLVAAMRDRAPVNTKALRTVSILYPGMLDVGCISHFLDTPLLKQFMTSWNCIFTTSIRGRMVWKEITGRVMPRYNATRWWSYWECAQVVFQEWARIPPFLQSDEEFAVASKQRLSEMMEQSAVQLKVELAALMELEKFVKATYTLEGDDLLIFIAFQKLEELRAFIHIRNFPSLIRTVQELFPLNVPEQQRWYQHGLNECLVPAFQYYLQTSENDAIVRQSVQVFRAAQLFNSHFVKTSRPNAGDVDRIRDVPFLNDAMVIQSLKDELPAYVVKADELRNDFNPQVDTLQWWKDVSPELPSWSATVTKLVLVQPSSAAAEQVFSLLVTMFGDQQHDALEDYVEAALMLRVNNR